MTIDIPTHFSTTLEFAGGPVGTLVMSFDTPKTDLPNLVIHGTEGTLNVCDPNWFDKPCHFKPAGADSFEPLPMNHAIGRARGTGVADLVTAIRSGREHRANGKLAHHVIEVMEGAVIFPAKGRHVIIESTCDRSAPLPAGLGKSEIDD